MNVGRALCAPVTLIARTAPFRGAREFRESTRMNLRIAAPTIRFRLPPIKRCASFLCLSFRFFALAHKRREILDEELWRIAANHSIKHECIKRTRRNSHQRTEQSQRRRDCKSQRLCCPRGGNRHLTQQSDIFFQYVGIVPIGCFVKPTSKGARVRAPSKAQEHPKRPVIL